MAIWSSFCNEAYRPLADPSKHMGKVVPLKSLWIMPSQSQADWLIWLYFLLQLETCNTSNASRNESVCSHRSSVIPISKKYRSDDETNDHFFVGLHPKQFSIY